MRTFESITGPIGRDIILNCIVNGIAFPKALRSRAWRVGGHNVHPAVVISPGAFLGCRSGLTIGTRTFVNYGCFLDLSAATLIDNNVDIGYGVMLITSTHTLGLNTKRAGENISLSITLEDGVWIDARSTVMPDVTIGLGCVVAARSVVTRDCEPDSFYAGVPAVLKRRL